MPEPAPHLDTRPERVFAWMDRHAADREQAGLRRRTRPRDPDEPVLDLASNDYLGLARHPSVTRAAAADALLWGAGSTGSRLVTGSTRLHEDLEREIAEFCDAEAALVFSSGYTANLAAVAALSGPDTLLVSDAHNHASLIDGCRLSRGTTVVASHADPTAVAAILADPRHQTMRRRLVISDSVFSVDGDLAPLAELAAASRAHGAALLVDDAHALGVVGTGGTGAVAAAGLAGRPDVVTTSVLSKSLGAQGGVVLGPRRVIDHLVDTARTFIFDTGLAPASAGAALAALRLLRAEPERAARARAAATALYGLLTGSGLTARRPDAAVVSVRAPSAADAVGWARRCLDAGVRVGCFRPPSVPDHWSRLRLTARADLTADDIDRAVTVLAQTAP